MDAMFGFIIIYHSFELACVLGFRLHLQRRLCDRTPGRDRNTGIQPIRDEFPGVHVVDDVMMSRGIRRTTVLDEHVLDFGLVDETRGADGGDEFVVLRGDDEDFVDEFLDDGARVEGDRGGAVGAQVDAGFAAARGHDLVDELDADGTAFVGDRVDAL